MPGKFFPNSDSAAGPGWRALRACPAELVVGQGQPCSFVSVNRTPGRVPSQRSFIHEQALKNRVSVERQLGGKPCCPAEKMREDNWSSLQMGGAGGGGGLEQAEGYHSARGAPHPEEVSQGTPGCQVESPAKEVKALISVSVW